MSKMTCPQLVRALCVRVLALSAGVCPPRARRPYLAYFKWTRPLLGKKVPDVLVSPPIGARPSAALRGEAGERSQVHGSHWSSQSEGSPGLAHGFVGGITLLPLHSCWVRGSREGWASALELRQMNRSFLNDTTTTRIFID